jgi:hypothetical protein
MDQSTQKGNRTTDHHTQLLVKLVNKCVSGPLTCSGRSADSTFRAGFAYPPACEAGATFRSRLEEHELALIFQANGLPKDDAQRIAGQIMQDKLGALDAIAREELGIDPAELGRNPWTAAATSFALF